MRVAVIARLDRPFLSVPRVAQTGEWKSMGVMGNGCTNMILRRLPVTGQRLKRARLFLDVNFGESYAIGDY